MIATFRFDASSETLDGILEQFARLHDGDLSPDDAVCFLEGWGSPPMPGHNSELTAREMIEQEMLVFLPMHRHDEDDTQRCIDGERRPSDDFDIGISDAYGFLLEANDEQILLHPALYDGTSNFLPRINLQATCSCLEPAMRAFATSLGGVELTD